MSTILASRAEASSLTKPRIIAELTRSPHGALDDYLPIGTRAAKQDAEFFAHMIAWNGDHGQVRDAKVALPVVQLITLKGESPTIYKVLPLRENALAHLALLSPRDLVRGATWAYGKVGNHPLRSLVKRYLRERERVPSWWERSVLAHRASMAVLYRIAKIAPGSETMNDILFHGARPAGTLFDVLHQVRTAPSEVVVSLITQHRLPFLPLKGALNGREKNDPAIGMALIERMSPTDLVTNTKMLERIGLNTNPAMRAAYDAKLQEVGKSKKTTFKATRAAETLSAGGSTVLAEKLRGAQEKSIDALGQVKGVWAVLADKSGSMQLAIDVARVVASTLARVAEEVHLVFFDTSPRYVEATGKSYDALLAETKLINANGGTSIGCGLQYIADRGIEVGGIVVVSDGHENNMPLFAGVYKNGGFAEARVPVYFYRVTSNEAPYNYSFERSMEQSGFDMQVFDLRSGVDHYSLPNIIATMRANRYSLIDDIMATRLLTIDAVFARAGV